MKHNVLRSVAHNIADSFSSGMCFLVGLYEIDVFKEAEENENQVIIVDFLNGHATDGTTSLTHVVSLYHDALPDLCKRQNVSVTDFCKLIVHYSASRRVVIEIEDKKGRKSTDEYLGSPLTRIKIADSAGRIRPKPTLHT